MKNMDKNSSVYKMLLLGILCAVCGLALSAVNALTAPIIADNQLATIRSSLEEFYPGAEFEDVTEQYIANDETGLIDGIYEAKGKGYIFTLHGTGYNSNGFTFMASFDNDGSISGYKKLEENETAGIGKRAFEEDYTNQLLALTSSDPIPLLSGATLTSTAVQKGMDAAKAIFNEINNISYDPNAVAEVEVPEAKPIAEEDYTANSAACTVVSDGVFACSAKGFEGTNEATITVADGKVVSVEITAFNDTAGVGDMATTADELARYAGLTLDDAVDSTSGASFTSASIRAMIKEALSGNATAGNEEEAGETAADPYAANNVTIEEVSNDGTTAVYACTAKGFEGINEATVTIDLASKTVAKVEVTAFNDTAGVGDAATADDYLAKYEGVSSEEDVEVVSGASFTITSIKAMVHAALQAAGE